jgi:hypothetical protein
MYHASPLSALWRFFLYLDTSQTKFSELVLLSGYIFQFNLAFTQLDEPLAQEQFG